MRLWSLHPKYLDRQGLTALWREGLLAQAVLLGRTVGYRQHPQLLRFKAETDPLAAIGAYLLAVHAEAKRRGYSFDRRKIERAESESRIDVSSGQLQFEWRHLLNKLAARSPQWHESWRSIALPECHPLFQMRPGAIEAWEKIAADRTADRNR